MNKILFPSAVLSLALWLVGGTSWYAVNYCDYNFAPSKSSISAPLFDVRDADFKASSNAIFSFPFSGDRVKIPEENQRALKKVAKYLNDNPNKQLVLSGQFASIEKNKTSFENLGFARAASIKTKLVENGARGKSIDIEGVRFDNTRFEKSQLIGGVNFTFTEKELEVDEKVLAEASVKIPDPKLKDTKAKSTKKVESVKKEPLFQGVPENVIPLNIYFGSSSTKYTIKMIPALKEYLDMLHGYLKANPTAKVAIVGHSDSKGNHKYNMRVSKYRARAVRDFLLENGFTNKQIEIDWHGPDAPLFDNETEEGRKKNRRVEISIKK